MWNVRKKKYVKIFYYYIYNIYIIYIIITFGSEVRNLFKTTVQLSSVITVMLLAANRPPSDCFPHTAGALI